MPRKKPDAGGVASAEMGFSTAVGVRFSVRAGRMNVMVNHSATGISNPTDCAGAMAADHRAINPKIIM